MNGYFIGILESIKSNQFDDDTFAPDKHNWALARSWYYKYGDAETISDKELLDLLYYFYVHENLDFYDNVRFAQVAESINIRYRIPTGNLLEMFSDFRKLVYEL